VLDYREIVISETEAVQGEWRIAASLNIVGVHMALLNTGKVLLFSADMHDYAAINRGQSALFDPVSEGVTYPDLPRNLFCSGHCILPDGRLLAAGGQSYAQIPWQIVVSLIGFGRGADHDVHTFDPVTETWSRHADMPRARWYPTCVTLPNGKALIVSGYWHHCIAPMLEQLTGSDQFAMNSTCEIFDPDTDTLTAPQPFLKNIGLYPFLHVLPGGFLFVHSWDKTRLLDLNKQAWLPQAFEIPSSGSRTYPGQGTSVLLPILPDHPQARVLMIGGSTALKPNTESPATDRADIFELNVGDQERSRWRETTPLDNARILVDAVLLPDRSVLVVNGAEKGIADHNHGAVLEAERFDPVTETWQRLAQAQVARLYHSTAVLLPDGRVLTAGSTGHEWPPDGNELRLEVFSPPYLARGPQPVIDRTPSQVTYGETFDVETGDARSITSVALIRPTTTTHNNNMDQRYVGLKIDEQTPWQLTVAAPPDPSIAPPGYYMLFIVNSDGVPSTAKFIRVHSGTPSHAATRAWRARMTVRRQRRRLHSLIR